MTHQHLIQFGPLMLAAYVIITTSLFLGAVNLLAARSKQLLPTANFLYTLSWVLPFVTIGRWYANAIGIDLDKGICSGEQVGQMLMLIVFGLLLPSYGVFGFVACNCPSFWQRYTALRTQPKQAL